MHGVILYGPPGAGKNTVTRALHRHDSTYALFQRLKVGEGRITGYRMSTASDIDAIRADGQVIWENRRYGALYVVDRPTLFADLVDHIPVLHLGQVEAIDAVVGATPGARWVVAYLWCPRDIAAARISNRGTGDLDARLDAWDATPPPQHPHVSINTADVSPRDAAQQIRDSFTTSHANAGPVK